MTHLTLTYPDELAESVGLAPAEFGPQVLLMAAMKMFELGKLSSGKAAELAGLSRVEFLDECGRHRVSAFNYADEDAAAVLRADLAAAGGRPT